MRGISGVASHGAAVTLLCPLYSLDPSFQEILARLRSSWRYLPAMDWLLPSNLAIHEEKDTLCHRHLLRDFVPGAADALYGNDDGFGTGDLRLAVCDRICTAFPACRCCTDPCRALQQEVAGGMSGG